MSESHREKHLLDVVWVLIETIDVLLAGRLAKIEDFKHVLDSGIRALLGSPKIDSQSQIESGILKRAFVQAAANIMEDKIKLGGRLTTSMVKSIVLSIRHAQCEFSEKVEVEEVKEPVDKKEVKDTKEKEPSLEIQTEVKAKEERLEVAPDQTKAEGPVLAPDTTDSDQTDKEDPVETTISRNDLLEAIKGFEQDTDVMELLGIDDLRAKMEELNVTVADIEKTKSGLSGKAGTFRFTEKKKYFVLPREVLKHALIKADGKVMLAAKILDITDVTIYNKLREFKTTRDALIAEGSKPEPGKDIESEETEQQEESEPGGITEEEVDDEKDTASGAPEPKGKKPQKIRYSEDWKLAPYKGLSPWDAEKYMRDCENNLTKALHKATNSDGAGQGISRDDFTNLLGIYRKTMSTSALEGLLKNHKGNLTAAFLEVSRKTGIPRPIFNNLVNSNSKLQKLITSK